jgi:hypothetical protein
MVTQGESLVLDSEEGIDVMWGDWKWQEWRGGGGRRQWRGIDDKEGRDGRVSEMMD